MIGNAVIFVLICCTTNVNGAKSRHTPITIACNETPALSGSASTICKKGLQLLEATPSCQGQDFNICCKRVGWLVAHQCLCLPEVSEQRRDKILGQSSKCSVESTDYKNGAKLFIGILTAARNQRARQAIRDTWGGHPGLHRVLFFSAKPTEQYVFDALRTEASRKKDIIILPSIWESYHNISHQTLEILRFAAADRDASHVMKADDDSYVRVDLLLRKIQEVSDSRLFLGAIENPGGGPHRDPRSPWFVNKEEWPSERYPPWAHGAGYVISKDIVGEIAAGAALQSSNHSLFKLEDISVGAWVEFVGQEKNWIINYVHDPAFNYNGCDAYDVVSHYIKPRAMLCMFQRQHRCCTKRTLEQLHMRGALSDGGGTVYSSNVLQEKQDLSIQVLASLNEASR